MTERHASQTLTRLYETVKAFHEKGQAIPIEGLPPLLKTILMAREVAKETEEELGIVAGIVRFRNEARAGRPPADIDQHGNVIRLQMPTRLRVVNPEGGAA